MSTEKNKSSIPPKQPEKKSSKLADFLDVRKIVERMQAALGESTDGGFAGKIGVGSAQTISQYKRGVRDLPWEVVVLFSRLSRESLDWIILGERRAEPSNNYSQSSSGNGNAAASGPYSRATSHTTGQITPSGSQGDQLSQIERDFINAMRKPGRLEEWAECFRIVERAKSD